jgi:hypothetical protein
MNMNLIFIICWINPKDFFESNINIDVKIKVLNELDFKTVRFLCTINDKVKQIYNTEKFWRYRIYHFLHEKFCVDKPIHELVTFYKKNALCYCNNEICSISHPNLEITNPYCAEHLWDCCRRCGDTIDNIHTSNKFNWLYCVKCTTYWKELFKCQYRVDRNQNEGVICGKSVEYNIEIPYCNTCKKKSAILNRKKKRSGGSSKFICGYKFPNGTYCGYHIFVKNKLDYCEHCLKKYVFQIQKK